MVVVDAAPPLLAQTPAGTPPATVSAPATKKQLPPLILPDVPDDEPESTPVRSPVHSSAGAGSQGVHPEIHSESDPTLMLPYVPKDVLDDDIPPMPGDEHSPANATVTTLPAALPIPPGPPICDADLPTTLSRIFRIDYAGRLVGYSKFEITGTMSLGGDNAYIIDSQARLKLGVGAPSDSTFQAKLMVHTNDLTPTYYKCMQSSGASNFSVECLYSKTLIAQTNGSGKVQQQNFQTLDGATPQLLFNNLWGHLDTFPEHYWLLVRSAIKGGTLKTYDPILRGGGNLVVYAPKAERWKWEGRTIDTLVYPISDMEGNLMAHVRLTKNLDLLEVREIGSGLCLTRTTDAIVAEVAKVKPLDLLSRRVMASNVIFSEPEKLTSMDADITVALRGGELIDHKINNYSQTFTGKADQGYLKGHVSVRTSRREGTYTTKYPFRKADRPSPALMAYTKPGPGVESDWPTIANKARELAWKSENTFQAARRLMNFCTQIEEGVSLPSARYAMESSVGNPESKALLMVAMCRAVGLPARRIGGLLYRDGQFVPHNWAEVWLGPTEGWTPFDPTTVEAGRINATHIALWDSGDVERMNINVTNYSPRAAHKVAFFNRELNWGVGEQRTYTIMKDGKKIGEEVAAVRELVVDNDDEAYRFESTTSLTANNSTLNTTGELMVNPQGLPLSFQTEQRKNKPANPSIIFVKDTAKFETGSQAKKNLKIREVPFSFGTYMADQRFLSQWALAVGQSQDPKPSKSPKAGDKISFFVFVPETMKSTEITLEVKDPEPIKMEDGREVQATKLEAEGGMAFFVNPKGQVIKIDVPQQKLELLLHSSQFKPL
jgi:transglutaminase-like putative cysteine protease